MQINRIYTPLLLAVAMIIGLWLGMQVSSTNQVPFGLNQKQQKLQQIISYVEQDYVDSVSQDRLVDEAIAYLLQELDPHSYYLSPEQVKEMNEPIEGSFEGVGIQFNILNDTLYVINTVAGGPAETAGLRAGDRIISIDKTPFAGEGITNRDVMLALKGPSGSEVSVTVKRNGEATDQAYTITRGEIPLASVDAAFMLSSDVAYVKISKFSLTTHQEFLAKTASLKGAPKMILDLRGNGGGVIDAAVEIADQFLQADKLIVYTEGKARPRRDYYATEEGRFRETDLVVLIDEFTASASEILAGALQDHERAKVIGRRSFGKGLVQEQNQWVDGSATRLTVARYYTPNGRSIQKPYTSIGDMDGLMADSTLNQAPTIGGIEPNIKVEFDTAGMNMLYTHLSYTGLLYRFALEYSDQHRQNLVAKNPEEFINSERLEAQLESSLKLFLTQAYGQLPENDWQAARARTLNRVKAMVGRNTFGEEVYYKISITDDPMIRAAKAYYGIAS